jgi:hypothetical protein
VARRARIPVPPHECPLPIAHARASSKKRSAHSIEISRVESFRESHSLFQTMRIILYSQFTFINKLQIQFILKRYVALVTTSKTQVCFETDRSPSFSFFRTNLIGEISS